MFYRQSTWYRYKTKRNPHNLRPLCTSAAAPLSFTMGIWNCQSAVYKDDFISAFATQSILSILALTETWIRPEDTATTAALSNNFSFSNTPQHTGRGGGTGQLTNFLEELYVLISSLLEDGRPLVVLGYFNIHQDKPQAMELNTLLASFDWKDYTPQQHTDQATNWTSFFTRNCINSNIVSDNFFVQFNMTLPSTLKQTPPLVSFHSNLCSLSPSRLSTAVSTSLPTQNVFSMLDVNTATDTLNSTLTICLDNICPLSCRPARTTPPSPWLSDILREHQTDLRAAERRWWKSRHPADLEQTAG
ncbi:uncharacterized protein LOC127632506 isoform X2 [Xyrauchen texanus]|uniref:uncharacterized protein LOC127632506 isoform X2 n=1 Tax=Xyrauchen texanus TaxID=154827 RepID=UPI002241917E|nr:uncharacterized protein LOC127632506 isoform X2 [Xyrauchen texanus]